MGIFSFCLLKEVEDIALLLKYRAYIEASFKEHNMERMLRVWKLTHCQLGRPSRFTPAMAKSC